MKQNNIIAALQIVGVKAAYAVWRRNHVGAFKAFYKFMTTPSVERDEYLANQNTVAGFSGNIATITVNLIDNV